MSRPLSSLPSRTHLIVLSGFAGVLPCGRRAVPAEPGGRTVVALLLPARSRSRSCRVGAPTPVYASLGPSLTATLLHSTSVVYGGLSLFVLAGVAAGTVLALNRAEPRPVLYLSIGALIAGVAVTLAADSADSVAGFFAGTAIAGVGFGGGFQGGIRLVIPLAGERERAGVLSLLYVVSYLGLGVPAVIAGVLVTEVSGLLEVAREYGVAVIVLAVLALAGLLLTRKAESPVQDAGGVAYVHAGDGPWAVQGDADEDVPVRHASKSRHCPAAPV